MPESILDSYQMSQENQQEHAYRIVYEWELPPLRAIYRDEIIVTASSEESACEQIPLRMSSNAHLRKIISIMPIQIDTEKWICNNNKY